MKGLVTYVATAIVDDPRSVRVIETVSGANTRLYLEAAESDLGRLVGRQGRTARALRVLLAVAGRKAGRSCVLEIGE